MGLTAGIDSEGTPSTRSRAAALARSPYPVDAGDLVAQQRRFRATLRAAAAPRHAGLLARQAPPSWSPEHPQPQAAWKTAPAAGAHEGCRCPVATA